MAQLRALNSRGLELARLLAGLVEAAWLSVLVVTALHLNPYSLTGFEPDKSAMARTLVLVVAATWVASRVLGERCGHPNSGRAGRIAAVVLAGWVGSEVLSAVLSVTPVLSWTGSYARRQGAWLEIGYVVLFAVVAVEFRDWAQWRRVRFAITATSVPICILAMMQRFGLVGLASTGAIGSTLGNSTFLAGYLLFPLFVTADFVAERLATGSALERAERPRLGRALSQELLPVTIFLLQGVTLLSTGGAAALLGVVVSVVFLASLAMVAWRGSPAGIVGRDAHWSRPAVSVAMIAMLLVASLMASWLWVRGAEDASSRQRIVRLATMVNPDRETNEVRLLVWGAVVDAIAAPATGRPHRQKAPWRLLTGYGQETTWLVIEPHYPPQLARYEGWQVVADRAHNQVLEVLLARGLLGLAGYLVVAFGLLWVGLRAAGLVAGTKPLRPLRSRLLALLLTGALLAHLVETQFGIAITATELHFWLLGGVLVALGHGQLAGAGVVRRGARDGGVAGLLVALMLATMAFTVMSRGATAPSIAGLLMAASWLCGLVLGRPGSGRAGRQWALRFVVASAAGTLAYVGFHAWQLRTAGALGARGDELGAAASFASLFGGYHAWVLVIVVAVGVLLARLPAAPVIDDEVGPRAAVSRWRRARNASVVGILLTLGWVLPRAATLQAVRADILAAQADAALRRGSYASAATLYRQALALRSEETVYRFGLARVQVDWAVDTRKSEVRDRRLRRGVRQLRHAMRSAASDSTSHANLARLYTRWGELDSRPAQRAERWRLAERQYRAALRRRPGSARYFAEWGRLALLRGDADLATERFVQSLSQNATSGQAYLWLQPLLSHDLLDGAEVLGELGAAVGGISSSQVYAALVAHHAQAGALPEAIRAAHKLDESTPDDATGARALAVLYHRAGDYEMALAHAQRALSLSSGRDRREVQRLLETLRTATGSAANVTK